MLASLSLALDDLGAMLDNPSEEDLSRLGSVAIRVEETETGWRIYDQPGFYLVAVPEKFEDRLSEKTIAEQCAETLGFDGAHYPEDWAQIVERFGAKRECRPRAGGGNEVRYIFADGSAIVDVGVAWDIEGSIPYSWRSVE